MIFTRYLILAGKKEDLLVLSYVYLFVRSLFENCLKILCCSLRGYRQVAKYISNNTGIRICGNIELIKSDQNICILYK